MWLRLYILIFALIAVRAEAASEVPSGDPQISVIVVQGDLLVGDDEKFVKVALPLRRAVVNIIGLARSGDATQDHIASATAPVRTVLFLMEG
jgi:hypothetical protein